MAENPPSRAGDWGSASDQGTKIPHGLGPLGLPATTREKPAGTQDPACPNWDMMQPNKTNE